MPEDSTKKEDSLSVRTRQLVTLINQQLVDFCEAGPPTTTAIQQVLEAAAIHEDYSRAFVNQQRIAALGYVPAIIDRVARDAITKGDLNAAKLILDLTKTMPEEPVGPMFSGNLIVGTTTLKDLMGVASERQRVETRRVQNEDTFKPTKNKFIDAEFTQVEFGGEDEPAGYTDTPEPGTDNRGE